MSVISRPAPHTSPTDQPGGAPAYALRGRDLRIDFVRGLCVIAMIVDHVAGTSWLYGLTGGNHFYTSAAEGFIFVSGLVAGRAYTRFIARDGLSYGLGRVLGRASQLYLLAVGLTLAFVPVSEVLHLPWALGWDLHDAVGFVVSVVTLHRTYYLVDVMVLYVLLLLGSSIALVLLTRGQTWLVLGGSWLLWLLYQVFPGQADVPWTIVGNNLFHFAAWQVLFFTGLVIGHVWENAVSGLGTHPLSRWQQAVANVFLTPARRRRALLISGALLAVVIALYAFEDLILGRVFADSTDAGLAQANLIAQVTGKSDLRLGRVLVFALVFVVFFLAVTEWWRILRRWLGWLVLPLGQNALYAYSAHVVISVGAAIALLQFGGVESAPARENAAIQLASVLCVWGLVQMRFIGRVFSTRQVSVAIPAVLAAAAIVMLPRIVPEVTAKDASAASATAANSNTATASSADVQAKAFGTAIPDNKEPAVPASASDPPRVQDTASNVAQPDSNAAGKLQGTLLEPEFYSTALNTQERYFIYLPPGYHNQGQKLPVLYMLHGAGGRGEWLGYDLIGKADAGIASGKLPQMLIVLPQGDDGYWVNHQSGGPKWGDYLIQDLVKHIDSTYRTQPDAKHRALGGMSMGGWGALYQGFTHPEEFGVVGAHAAALRQDLPFLPKGDQFNQFDPVQLAANAPNLTSQRVWIDADEQDPWVKRDADVHNRLDTRHISNEWHTFPGRHGGSYWADHVPDYLNFYGKALSGS